MEKQKLETSDKAEQFLIEASEFVFESNYFEAILSCNKSLCCAKPKSSNIALAYEKRSSIFFTLKEYQKCLDDIGVARETGCELNDEDVEREKLCKSELTKGKSSEAPWDFFKLSYSQNEKIPFIVDCLKPQENCRYGRCVITTRSLNPGDVVAIDEPFLRMLKKEVRYKRCAFCLKSNKMCLLPCPGKCTSSEFLNILPGLVMISEFSAMFCSSTCLETAWETSHKYECSTIDESFESENEYDMTVLKIVFESLTMWGSVSNLQSQFNDIKSNPTVFNFDLRTNNADTRCNLLKSVLSLMNGPASEEDLEMADWIVDSHPLLRTICTNQSQKDFLKSFVIKIMGILDRNSYILFGSSLRKPSEKEETGSGVFPFASLLNHSCSPNLYRIFVDNKQVFIVKKPIPAGAQLFVGYQ